ncbi:MAG: MltA domain-containing protein, partial [Asticcacaulis sp.]
MQVETERTASRRGRLRHAAAIAALLFVAACAQAPQTPVVTPPAAPAPPATPPSEEPPYVPGPNPVPETLRLSTLPGWSETDPFIAIEALRATCAYKKGRQYAQVCAAMATEDFESPDQIRDFLNSHLQIEAIPGTGTLTGYFVP